jgi:hypothetical protein
MSENRLLTELRTFVLQRSDKRMPKWQFRLDDDLVMQLQPQAKEPFPGTERELFRGRAIHGRDIPLNAFKDKSLCGFVQMHFRLYTLPNSTAWKFRLGMLQGHCDNTEVLALRDRILTALIQLEQLDASNMFQPACLACGKKLTDPISMARWFGPECAHTASPDVRRTYRLTTPQAA